MCAKVASSGSKLFLAIAGNIGTGKTSLTKLLSEKHSWEAHYEVVVDNPYLKDFYKDMARWSFPIQIFFLNSRFKAHKKIIQNTNSAIQDRTIYEDANIFARNLYESGLMEKRDYFNYLDLHHEMVSQLTPPDLLIYLRKSLPSLRSNIARRGRDYEATIDEDYLNNLNRYYDDWIGKHYPHKVLVIHSDTIDFVNFPEHAENVSQRIFQALDQQVLFR